MEERWHKVSVGDIIKLENNQHVSVGWRVWGLEGVGIGGCEGWGGVGVEGVWGLGE